MCVCVPGARCPHPLLLLSKTQISYPPSRHGQVTLNHPAIKSPGADWVIDLLIGSREALRGEGLGETGWEVCVCELSWDNGWDGNDWDVR